MRKDFRTVFLMALLSFSALLIIFGFLIRVEAFKSAEQQQKEVALTIHEEMRGLVRSIEAEKPERFESKSKEKAFYSLMEDLNWLLEEEQENFSKIESDKNAVAKEIAYALMMQYILILNVSFDEFEPANEASYKQYIETAKKALRNKNFTIDDALALLQDETVNKEALRKHLREIFASYQQFLGEKMQKAEKENDTVKAFIEARKIVAMRKE